MNDKEELCLLTGTKFKLIPLKNSLDNNIIKKKESLLLNKKVMNKNKRIINKNLSFANTRRNESSTNILYPQKKFIERFTRNGFPKNNFFNNSMHYDKKLKVRYKILIKSLSYNGKNFRNLSNETLDELFLDTFCLNNKDKIYKCKKIMSDMNSKQNSQEYKKYKFKKINDKIRNLKLINNDNNKINEKTKIFMIKNDSQKLSFVHRFRELKKILKKQDEMMSSIIRDIKYEKPLIYYKESKSFKNKL
jgi:hypothetical protein